MTEDFVERLKKLENHLEEIKKSELKEQMDSVETLVNIPYERFKAYDSALSLLHMYFPELKERN